MDGILGQKVPGNTLVISHIFVSWKVGRYKRVLRISGFPILTFAATTSEEINVLQTVN